MQTLIGFLVLGLCATSLGSSVIYEDLDLKSVVIDDSDDFNLELIPYFDDETTTQNYGGKESCQNSNGVAGTCKKLGDCFPYLAGESPESLESSTLYDIIKTVAENCTVSGLVCCPDFSNNKLPTKKPTFEETTLSPKNITENNFGIRENCGANHYQEAKVLGGVDSSPGEFPYMVSLVDKKKGKHFCGGSLLDSEWVLTAAHCIANIKSLGNVIVNLGDHDVTNQTEVTHQSQYIKKGFYHREFSFRTLKSDIALLQLSKPFTLGDSIQPICLNNMPGPAEAGKVVLIGWGKKGTHLPPASILQKVKMSIVPIQNCKQDYATDPNSPPLTDNNMCAGDKSPTRDACYGDSGGPLSVITENGKALQVGIVSFGTRHCGSKPAVYTRVDKYLLWIKKHGK